MALRAIGTMPATAKIKAPKRWGHSPLGSPRAETARSHDRAGPTERSLVLIDYLDYFPVVADLNLGRSAVVIGRTAAGAGLTLRDFAVLRADGERIDVGENVFFGERVTVHIADGARPARIGRDGTIGRYSLVHACTLAA